VATSFVAPVAEPISETVRGNPFAVRLLEEGLLAQRGCFDHLLPDAEQVQAQGFAYRRAPLPERERNPTIVEMLMAKPHRVGAAHAGVSHERQGETRLRADRMSLLELLEL
jgi:hypothetical protein